MNDLLEENLGEGPRKGQGRVGGKEGEGQEKGNVKQELISYDRTHCRSLKVEWLPHTPCSSPRVEVHILNAANIIDLVHIHTLGRREWGKGR